MNFDRTTDELFSIIKAANKTNEIRKFNSLGHGEMAVLSFLIHHYDDDQPITPGDLSSIEHVSTARIANVLSGLEEKEFISRQINKDDRRKISVILTEKGRNEIITVKSKMHDRVKRTLEQMGEKDSQEFLRTFTKFINTIKGTD